MKKAVLKYALIVVANALPFAIDTMLYSLGVMVDLLLFMPVIVGITIFNFCFCKNHTHRIIMQAFMATCIICSSYISDKLWLANYSDDSETLLVMQTELAVGVATVVVATIIASIIKSKIDNRKKQFGGYDMFCSNCGKELSAGARFCGWCGKKIETAGAQNEAAAPVPEAAAPVQNGVIKRYIRQNGLGFIKCEFDITDENKNLCYKAVTTHEGLAYVAFLLDKNGAEIIKIRQKLKLAMTPTFEMFSSDGRLITEITQKLGFKLNLNFEQLGITVESDLLMREITCKQNGALIAKIYQKSLNLYEFEFGDLSVEHNVIGAYLAALLVVRISQDSQHR